MHAIWWIVPDIDHEKQVRRNGDEDHHHHLIIIQIKWNDSVHCMRRQSKSIIMLREWNRSRQGRSKKVKIYIKVSHLRQEMTIGNDHEKVNWNNLIIFH